MARWYYFQTETERHISLLNLLSNFLRNRKLRVKLNGQTSSWAVVNARVPQGSILGPLLLLIYINGLADGLLSNVKLFEDDTSLFLLFIMQMPQQKN